MLKPTLAASLAAFVCTALAFGGWAQDGIAAPPSRLDKLFQLDMLGAQVTYFEQFSGLAWQDDGTTRRYKVDGCTVGVGVNAGKVRSLALEQISSKCKFPLERFITNGKFPELDRMRFGDFDKQASGARFQADCLTMCGNAYDPSVYDFWEGPHAENFIEVKIGVVLVDDAALKASSAWQAAMEKAEGEDYVVDAKFNCSLRYDDVAHRVFAAVRITSIEVGYGITDLAAAGCK